MSPGITGLTPVIAGLTLEYSKETPKYNGVTSGTTRMSPGHEARRNWLSTGARRGRRRRHHPAKSETPRILSF